MTQAETAMLTDIKIEVAMLKQEVSFINKLFERMEVLIEKVDTQYETLVDKTSKIESNLSYTKEELQELYQLLTQTERTINDKIDSVEKALNKDIDQDKLRLNALEEKTEDLLQSKWTIAGATGVVLWIISNIDFVKKIFIR